MIFRVCVWLSPLHAPIRIDRVADIIRMLGSISSYV